MVEEIKKDPQFKAKVLESGESVKLTLTKAKEIATGESKYGEWNLWAVKVENATVYERDQGADKEVKGYTGDAIMFPSAKLHEKFQAATNGTKEGVVVEITMAPKKTIKGSLYTNYELKVLEDGITPSTNVLPAYATFLEDFDKFKEAKVIVGTHDDFNNLGSNTPYNLSKEQLTKIWVIYDEKKNGKPKETQTTLVKD